MKKFLIAAVISLLVSSSFASGPGEIDEQFVQSFNSSFPNAKDVKWSEQKDAFIATFADDATRARVIYAKDKSFVHLTRYYVEPNLPFGVLYKIQKEYPHKKVYCVTEVSIVSEPGNKLAVEYYVKLEDNKHWTTVKLDSDGAISVVEKYRKAL